MEKQIKFYLSIPFVALTTLALLAVPLIAMQFTAEVNWSVSDFIIMGALIFGTGSLFAVALRSGKHLAYRAGMVVAIGTAFLMIWVNLAVGLIGAGPNAGNLMFAGVIIVLIVGIWLSKFQAVKLERAMFATAFSVLVVGFISLLLNLQSLPESSVLQIIGVCTFFAGPFVVSGLLFRYVNQQR